MSNFTAGLSAKEMVEMLLDIEQKNWEKRRAMMLSWVDELERLLEYGNTDHPPRTSQIRQYWRDSGEPSL